MSHELDLNRALPANLFRQVTEPHPYRFKTWSKATGREVEIDRTWSLVLGTDCGGMTAKAADHLRSLLKATFGIALAKRAKGTPAIEVSVDAELDANPEAYGVSASEDGIRIIAASDEGGMRALFQLGWDLVNGQRPVISTGQHVHRPQWGYRITNTVLHRPLDQAGDYAKLPREYLLNLARYGYNAVFLYIDWFDFMTPASGGKLARPGWKDRLVELRHTASYLGEYGIRLLFHVNMLAQPKDHPAFAATPSMRGAQTWTDGLHCLCTSAPETLKLFERAAKQLYTDVPELAGAVLIVGGECFLHCYTRPFPKPESGTNCPRCAKLTPDKVIADAVNAFSRGAHAGRSDAKVFAWPYSAFSWGDTKAQISMLKQLDQDVAFLSSFEKDDWITVDGEKSYVFDYSIAHMGPSPLFTTLREASVKQGRETYARTETSQCIEMFNVPRIPVMNRWAERYEKLRKANLNGVHTTWRFYGFAAQRTDEIVNYMNWADKPDVGTLLKTMAVRDFGKSAAGAVLKAWSIFSDTFARFPYCGGVTGFPYFRGPFYIGAAHPFVFDLSAGTGLSQRFTAVDPSMEEGLTDLELLEATRQPKYFVDSVWTQPLGEKIVGKRLAELDRDWQKGVKQLEAALAKTAGDDRHRLESELGVAKMINCMFRTGANLVKFHQLRDQVTREPTTADKVRKVCDQVVALLRDELANAETALALTEKDPSLGYGATYGYAFDAELLREKIAHTKREISYMVPRFHMMHAFHSFGVFVQD